MKVAKYDMRKTCKISGQNLKKQKSFSISECGKMDQKSPSKGDIGGNLLSADFVLKFCMSSSYHIWQLS